MKKVKRKSVLNSLFIVLFFLFAHSLVQAQNNIRYYIETSNKHDTKHGLIDSLGNKIIEEEYYSIHIYKDRNRIVLKKDTICELLDENLKKINLRQKYYKIVPVSKDRLIVTDMNDRYKGVVNESGNEIISMSFDNIEYHDEGYFWVEKDDKQGLFNLKGKSIINTQYDNIIAPSDLKQNMIAVKINGKYGYVDKKDKQLIFPKFIHADNFISGVAIVETEQGFNIINKKGVFLLNTFYKTLERYPQNNFYVAYSETQKTYLLLNLEFKEIGSYDSCIPWLNTNLYPVRLNGKYGFINKNGKLIINCQYQGICSFYNNLAFVKKNDKWGVINSKGEVIHDFIYEGELYEGVNGYATYKIQNGKKGLLSPKGSLIISPKYQSVEYLFGNKAIIEIEKNKYLFDFVKNEIIAPINITNTQKRQIDR